MDVSGKYIKDENGEVVSLITSSDTIYDEFGYNAFKPHLIRVTNANDGICTFNGVSGTLTFDSAPRKLWIK